MNNSLLILAAVAAAFYFWQKSSAAGTGSGQSLMSPTPQAPSVTPGTPGYIGTTILNNTTPVAEWNSQPLYVGPVSVSSGLPTYTTQAPQPVPTTTYQALGQLIGFDPNVFYTADGWSYWLKMALVKQGVVSMSATGGANQPGSPWWAPNSPAVFPNNPEKWGDQMTLGEYMALAIPWLQQHGFGSVNFGGPVIQTSAGPVWVVNGQGVAGLGSMSWAV